MQLRRGDSRYVPRKMRGQLLCDCCRVKYAVRSLISHQVLYPRQLRDRLFDGRLEVAVFEIKSVLPTAYLR